MDRESVNIGEWNATVVRDVPFWLDAGTLFGMVPKTLWSRKVKPDKDNRVPVALNSLLLRNGKRTVLLDAGIGGRYSAKLEKHHKLDRSNSLLKELHAEGVEPDDIDTVILSHLHLDHTGWCVKENEDGKLVPTFPNASYYVQNSEFNAAYATNELTRGSYILDDIEPIKKAGQLKRVRGEHDLKDGLRLLLTAGHSPGHQMLRLESGDDILICPGEIVPSTHHLRLSWVMAYDAVPGQVVDLKRTILSSAAENGWLAFLMHEMGPALGTFTHKSDEEYGFTPLGQ